MADVGFIERKSDNRRAKSNFPFVLVFAIIAVIMGIGGFFVGRTFTGWNGNISNKNISKTQTSTTSQQKKADQKKINTPVTVGKTGVEEDNAKLKPGIIFLEPFTVNLNDPFGRRYAEVAVNLVLDDKIMVNKITENELMIPRIRDEVFMIISGKSYADLKSTSGKVTLKEEIMIRVNEILKDEFKKEPVIQVLFTRFLIQ